MLSWLGGIFRPRRAGAHDRVLFRCSCGRLLWDNAPQRVWRHHEGHVLQVAQRGTLREWLVLRLGLLNRLTWRERLEEKGWR